jgi:aspartate racemase
MTYLSKNQKHLLGILGGVGPLSHVEFEKELLAESFKRGARSDQDHPVWMLVNASATPDRTKSLLTGEGDAEGFLIHYAKLLESTGASCIFVICNTAHGFHTNVQKHLSIPWIHIMQIVAESIKQQYPHMQKVGIIGTDATVKLRLYHDALERNNMSPIAPNVGSVEQQMIMNAIYHKEYGVKATGSNVSPKAINDLTHAALWCKENGAEAVIAACTEVSVALTHDTFTQLPIIDPLKVAATIALDIAAGKRHPREFMLP